MSQLRIEPVDEGSLEDWRYVHNLIIPTDPLSSDEVRERLQRNRLEVAYVVDVLVGCATIRPPVDSPTATVIVRVLPEHRRRGYGLTFYERELATARSLGADVIETIILLSNTDGLRFAEARGFVEFERYLLPGDTVPFLTMRLEDAAT